jgi:ATP-dependent protease ClpP protease subunit
MLHIATIGNSVVLSGLAIYNSWHLIKTNVHIVVQTINKQVEIETSFQSLSIF